MIHCLPVMSNCCIVVLVQQPDASMCNFHRKCAKLVHTIKCTVVATVYAGMGGSVCIMVCVCMCSVVVCANVLVCWYVSACMSISTHRSTHVDLCVEIRI